MRTGTAARAQHDAENTVADRIAFDRHGADLDAPAPPVAHDCIEFVVAGLGAAAHPLDLGSDALDVLWRDDIHVRVPRSVPESVYRRIVQPEDAAVRVADERRHVDVLKRRLQHMSSGTR